MNRLAKALILVLLWSPLGAFGQSREELQGFIIGEFKSFESFHHTVEEAWFSRNGDTFTYRRTHTGRLEKGLVIPLKEVDIYVVEWHTPTGIDTFNLVAATRGREGTMQVNGVPFRGIRSIFTRVENERKVRALDRAFNRLITLATGRKDPLQGPDPAR